MFEWHAWVGSVPSWSFFPFSPLRLWSWSCALRPFNMRSKDLSRGSGKDERRSLVVEMEDVVDDSTEDHSVVERVRASLELARFFFTPDEGGEMEGDEGGEVEKWRRGGEKGWSYFCLSRKRWALGCFGDRLENIKAGLERELTFYLQEQQAW